MQPFKFVEASDSQNAVKSYGPQSQYLAGGTTLVDLMKLQVMTPPQLIDLSSLPLKKIVEHGSQIEVGALVTNSEMAHSALVKDNFPFISEAILSGASVQLRNLATTAGNILQKTRCSYYRDPHAKCNKRNPGSGCDAFNGFNRMQAILGVSSHCISAHPSDLCVALMAVGARLKTEKSGGGSREIAFEDFYTLPGDTPHVENILEPGELITSVILTKRNLFKRSRYVKIRDRSSYAFALTSAAVAIDLDGKKVKEVRIALGGVGAIPWRATSAEAILTGQELTLDKMKEAAKSVTKNAHPRPFNAFKVALVEQTIIRALQEVEKSS